jgi:choice-of-anchor B domain-containing protein
MNSASTSIYKAAIWLPAAVILAVGVGKAAKAIPPPGSVVVDQRAIDSLEDAAQNSIADRPYQSSAPQLDTNLFLCEAAVFEFGGRGGSDIWGWEGPDGREYAIMGVLNGLAFVNATDLEVVQVVPGPVGGLDAAYGYYHREVRTYQHYAYGVSELTGYREGLQVMDLQYLPDSVHFIRAIDLPDTNARHNMTIDTARGFAYITCQYFRQGFWVYDLSEPNFPMPRTFVPTSGPYGVHDLFVRNDTAWVAEGGCCFSVWNMEDKDSPNQIGFIGPFEPGNHAHSFWPSEVAPVAVTTIESPYRPMQIWSVEDYSNIYELSRYYSPNWMSHHPRVKGHIIYLSQYEAGVVAIDISDPRDPTVLAEYDTWPQGNDTPPPWRGCWGVFPYTKSGLVYASNRDGKLIILRTRPPEFSDTLWGEDLIVTSGNKQIKIDLSLDNDYTISGLTIPFCWAGELNLSLDSASTVGLRTEWFEDQRWLVYSPRTLQAVYAIENTAGEGLPPGTGPVLSLYFTVPLAPDGAVNEITFEPFFGVHLEAALAGGCITYRPGSVPAVVRVACCEDVVGNVDQSPEGIVDIGDVTALIEHLFISMLPLPCKPEANVDGSLDGVIDVGDLTVLIQTLFINVGTPFRDCP